MVDESIQKKVLEYLSNHEYLTIATCHNDKPYASKIKYKSDKFDLYFATFSETNKGKVLLRNNLAACTIDDNSINEFIQFFGEVKLMDDKEEKVKACGILKNIFPYSKYWIYSNDILFFKIKPTTIKYCVGPADIAKGKYFGDIYEINL
ncbi:pyridoxamine 5'-phosphate oxidase family protein [Clostridium algidicarnis]|uniref:pyridoxamine 5'-phosphate oxidase family protein n=1 Tax=Clostridium algidicarnis TaxID=37659 RepID=UPI000495FB2F|nr:pyridoxamine 5'-phosphate oxidase family protein [Clostridium algidicarnis]